MRYFLISISVLLISCTSYPKKKNFEIGESPATNITNPYFSDSSKDYVYKADISVFQKNFSGLFIVKKLGEDRHRVAFTTEMGNKIFDFSFFKTGFDVNYIIPEIDKKMIISILKEDFKTLITEHPVCTSVFRKNQETLFECRIDQSKYYYHNLENRIEKIVKSRNASEKITYLFESVKNDKASLIKVFHKDIDLNIALKAIQ